MNELWYYVRDGEQQGPVPLEELRAMARDGRLAAGDLVWQARMTNWSPADQMPELHDVLHASASPGPVGVAPAPGAAQGPVARMSVTPGYGHDPVLAYRTSPQHGPVLATERSLEMLRRTRPWVRVVALVLYIGAGLFLLFGCIGGFALVAGAGRRGTFGVGVMAIVYVPIAVLYLVPALYLSRYASRINALLLGRREPDLEAALEAQKSFWKFVGIAILVVLGFYILIALIFMIGAMI